MVRGQISRYGWMLLLALIFSGLFAMHGMAATPSQSVSYSLVGGMPHKEAAEGSMPSAGFQPSGAPPNPSPPRPGNAARGDPLGLRGPGAPVVDPGGGEAV